MITLDYEWDTFWEGWFFFVKKDGRIKNYYTDYGQAVAEYITLLNQNL